jgi:hypothetical protein
VALLTKKDSTNKKLLVEAPKAAPAASTKVLVQKIEPRVPKDDDEKKKIAGVQKALTDKYFNNTPNKPQDPITHNASPTT